MNDSALGTVEIPHDDNAVYQAQSRQSTRQITSGWAVIREKQDNERVESWVTSAMSTSRYLS
jgi:hypothetical protein